MGTGVIFRTTPHRASNPLWPEKGLNEKLQGLELTEMVVESQTESIADKPDFSKKVLVKGITLLLFVRNFGRVWQLDNILTVFFKILLDFHYNQKGKTDNKMLWHFESWQDTDCSVDENPAIQTSGQRHVLCSI